MPLLEGEGEEKEGYCGWLGVRVGRKGGERGKRRGGGLHREFGGRCLRRLRGRGGKRTRLSRLGRGQSGGSM